MGVSHVASRPALKKLRYREHFRQYQAAAISMARRYRQEFHAATAEAKRPLGAALVCHPTGTGKTAVIAGLAQCAPEIGNVLVLTTRDPIRDQLVREVGANLFINPGKFNLGPAIRLAKICYAVRKSSDLRSLGALYRATAGLLSPELATFVDNQFGRIVGDRREDDLSEALERAESILVMTVQMLVELQRGRGALQQTAYGALRENIDLVLFDEGHYEPAAKWSGAVRDLAKPVVLLSATPFRNDLKAFQISPGNIHLYKYDAAVADAVVRDVRVVRREPAPTEGKFCDDVIDYCSQLWGADSSRWTQRVIIHCDDMASITRLGESFIARGFADKVVGIHDRYPPGVASDGWKRRSVPAPGQSDALIWIHQYKLLEGIDDHRFQVLAFFDVLGNVRSIVQQIGRVIRKGDNDTGLAWVLDHFGGRINRYWQLYKDFDESITAEELARAMSKVLVKDFTKVQPPVLYIDKKFRSVLQVQAEEGAQPPMTPEEVADEVLFERRVTLRRVTRTTTLEELTERIEDGLAEDDYEFTKYDVSAVSPHTVIYICAKVDNVGFLNNRYYALPIIEARMAMLLPARGMVATASTASGSGTDALSHLPPVSPAELERVVMPGAQGRISLIGSRNTNLSNRVVRRRTISAPSIADVPPILDEHGHVVSTVTGYNGIAPQVLDDIDYQETVDENFDITVRPALHSHGASEVRLLRRYVGLTTGRVSEQGPPLRVRAYRRWVESLLRQMRSRQSYPEVYGRYAALVRKSVTKYAPANLLLDFTDLTNDYVLRDSDSDYLRSDELCVDRSTTSATSSGATSRFKIKVNDKFYELDVTFNPGKNRYKLESPHLDEDFVPVGDRKVPLTRALNERQAFNIIPDDPEVIYVHGAFYAPGLKFGERFTPDEFYVGYCLYPAGRLKAIKMEKGAVVLPGDHYDPDSLFGLIDDWAQFGVDTDALGLDASWMRRYQPEAVKFSPTLCICDDMGHESADFIIADEGADRRVVLAHAKASSTYKKFSASAVQEVCAQAQKNTALFSTYSLREPPNLAQWDKPHHFTGKDKIALTVGSRLRTTNWPDGRTAWEGGLSPLLRNPLTSREIWLVLGNMLSANALYTELTKPDPRPESLQLNHLLQTTISAGASVSAKTRIFCAP